MTIRHLSDRELDLVLIGEPLAPEAAEHLASCLACRRQSDAFLAAVAEAAGSDPDEGARARVRERTLAAWGAARPRRRWPTWVAAAAAVLVLGLLPLLRGRHSSTPRLNPDTVLTDVDRVLAQDPLSEVAPDYVVNTVVPVPDEDEGEGSWS